MTAETLEPCITSRVTLDLSEEYYLVLEARSVDGCAWLTSSLVEKATGQGSWGLYAGRTGSEVGLELLSLCAVLAGKDPEEVGE